MSTAKRFQTNETAHVEVYGHMGVLKAHMKNISSTGAHLKFATGEYLPQKGDLVNVTVRLNSVQRTHNVAAEVIWSQDMRIGICFINKDQVLERMMAKSSAF